MKTIIERGASWTLEETKLLLAIWGQDYVQRKQTNIKRTKEVYEKISERFTQDGYERTAEQVRTRIFNMIAEYRRILKDGTAERAKKCIFFEALHKIYEAKHVDDIKVALDEYEPEFIYSPASTTHAHSSEKGDESVSDSEATDCNETMNSTASAAIGSSNATTSNSNTNTNNSQQQQNDNNNGDSNSTEKESSLVNNSHQTTTNKRIKLEPPKSSSAHQNQASPNQAATNASTSSTNSSTDHQLNAKHNKNSSTPSAATSNNTNATGTPIASSSSSQRHQSLLLPHSATSTSSATTPANKLTATSGSTSTPSYININPNKLPIIRTNQLIGHSNGNDSMNLNGTATRLPTTAAITSHQLYQAPVNTFDVTSSALLIDRMFAHLSRESENAREWIALEKERLALEKARKQQEAEREIRRERVLIDTLMRFQEQWLSFIARLDPHIVENAGEPVPVLKFPSKDTTSTDSPLNTQSSVTQNSTNSIPPPPPDASKQ